ncbi:hypothetical protein L0244_35085 [bacterium]|nr:hypothetical protein [bacterium]
MTERKQPLAEVFGYLITDQTLTAVRYRKNRLCPLTIKSPIAQRIEKPF